MLSSPKSAMSTRASGMSCPLGRMSPLGAAQQTGTAKSARKSSLIMSVHYKWRLPFIKSFLNLFYTVDQSLRSQAQASCDISQEMAANLKVSYDRNCGIRDMAHGVPESFPNLSARGARAYPPKRSQVRLYLRFWRINGGTNDMLIQKSSELWRRISRLIRLWLPGKYVVGDKRPVRDGQDRQ